MKKSLLAILCICFFTTSAAAEGFVKRAAAIVAAGIAFHTYEATRRPPAYDFQTYSHAAYLCWVLRELIGFNRLT